jgi:hypothetical protein
MAIKFHVKLLRIFNKNNYLHQVKLINTNANITAALHPATMAKIITKLSEKKLAFNNCQFNLMKIEILFLFISIFKLGNNN